MSTASRRARRARRKRTQHRAKWNEIALKTLLMPAQPNASGYLMALNLPATLANRKSLLDAWKRIGQCPAKRTLLFMPQHEWSRSLMELYAKKLVLEDITTEARFQAEIRAIANANVGKSL